MKNTNNIKGGEAIASGGFGCVFSPSLKCKGTKKRDKNKDIFCCDFSYLI